MRVDPALLHPSVLGLPSLSTPERVYLDTLQALADSMRSPDEMAEGAAVLNPLFDARLAAEDPAALDAVAQRILKAAQGARDAHSGMAVELCLDLVRLAYGEAHESIAQASHETHDETRPSSRAQ